MTTLCVATNPAGARCVYRGDHGNDRHLFPDDPGADSWRYGRLSAAVSDFLGGRSNLTALATIFVEVEATLP